MRLARGPSLVTAEPDQLASISTRPLLREAGVYTVSNVVAKAIPFLLLPVLTRYLSPADFGIVAMFLFVALLLEPFVGLALPGSITVRYFDRAFHLPRYTGTGVLLALVLAVLVELGVLLFREPMSGLTGVPADWLLLVVPFVLARVLTALPFTLLRLEGRAVAFGLFQNLQSAALIGLVFLLVVVLGRDWEGRIEAELVTWWSFAVAGLIGLWYAGWLKPAFQPSSARDIAAFGIPLIPHVLGSIVIFQADRLLLTNLVSVEETGRYAVGYQLAGVIELAAVSFNSAYAPWLYRQLAEPDDRTKEQLVSLTYRQFATAAGLSLLVALVMPWVAANLLDPAFESAGEYVVWFAIGFFFSAMYYMVTNYIFFARRTRWLAAVTVGVAVIHIPVAVILISLNGGIGAAQAFALSLALTFVLTWIVSNRAYPMPWLGTLRQGA